jgi:hypothetical protein
VNGVQRPPDWEQLGIAVPDIIAPMRRKHPDPASRPERPTMSDVTLAPDHAVELTELLEFLAGWLTTDREQLNASLLRYVGHPTYDINRLKADLARYGFLLGGDTDGDLFQPPTP